MFDSRRRGCGPHYPELDLLCPEPTHTREEQVHNTERFTPVSVDVLLPCGFVVRVQRTASRQKASYILLLPHLWFRPSRRYITKNLQKEFGFQGMQVRLTLKKSVNVYDPEGKGGSGKGRPKRKFGKGGRLLPQPPSPTRYRPGSHK